MEQEKKTYTIADRTFYQEPLAWGQEVWIRDHVLDGKTLNGLSETELQTVLRTKGTLFLAVILVEEGTTRAQKVMDGLDKVIELDRWLQAHLSPADGMEPLKDFFVLNQAGNLWLLISPGAPAPASLGETG